MWQTHEPHLPDWNIAEEYLESKIFRVHCKIVCAAEILNWRCLTPHQDGRVKFLYKQFWEIKCYANGEEHAKKVIKLNELDGGGNTSL